MSTKAHRHEGHTDREEQNPDPRQPLYHVFGCGKHFSNLPGLPPHLVQDRLSLTHLFAHQMLSEGRMCPRYCALGERKVKKANIGLGSLGVQTL